MLRGESQFLLNGNLTDGLHPVGLVPGACANGTGFGLNGWAALGRDSCGIHRAGAGDSAGGAAIQGWSRGHCLRPGQRDDPGD